VRHLLRDSDRRVRGVRLEGAEEVLAHTVILATGGYRADEGMVHWFLPKTKPVVERVWYPGHADNRGDGIAMSEEVGAAIRGTDSALLLTTPNFLKLFGVFAAYWALLVNERGERIVHEDGGYWEVAEALEAQPVPADSTCSIRHCLRRRGRIPWS
jgi:succinate dehydrogenase/fumarate reductase flavoprotein subunit